MISSEAQRTLVKSPPELWTELSEPESLARHLGELGEIRITRVEPETAVEWEAELLSGAVKIEPSGWGTKVTLTINRELPSAPSRTEDAEIGEEGEPASACEDADEPASACEDAGEPEAEADATHEPEAVADAVHEPQAVADAVEETEAQATADTGASELDIEEQPQRRRGFFARIFSSLRAKTRDPLLIDEATAEPAMAAPTVAPATVAAVAAAAAASATEPEQREEAEPLELDQPQAESSDLAAELAAVEEALASKDTALLTSVLDRLGAAHHRPFSRA